MKNKILGPISIRAFFAFAVLIGTCVFTAREISPNHSAFALPWGKTWRNRTKISSSLCEHFVEKKDFVGFEDTLPFCRFKQNRFYLGRKIKSVPRSVSRHLVDWSVNEEDAED